MHAQAHTAHHEGQTCACSRIDTHKTHPPSTHANESPVIAAFLNKSLKVASETFQSVSFHWQPAVKGLLKYRGKTRCHFQQREQTPLTKLFQRAGWLQVKKALVIYYSLRCIPPELLPGPFPFKPSTEAGMEGERDRIRASELRMSVGNSSSTKPWFP